MLQDVNYNLESKNFVDDVNFNKNDPCIFVVYPPGASGDLLATIIDKHYLKSGCEYYGINKDGQVIFRPTDYKITNNKKMSELFTDQWFYDIADCLANRNLNYSLLDQVIFSNHLHTNEQINCILDHLPNAKIIKIFAQTNAEMSLINYQHLSKNENQKIEIQLDLTQIENSNIIHDRVLNIPYKTLFVENFFERIYTDIVDFLELESKLIRFDFVDFYLKKQSPYFLENLKQYYQLLR